MFYSLNSLYQWDNKLFDTITLPTLLEPLRPQIINNIIIQCGRMEPAFSEPDVFKMVMENWFLTWGPNFKHLYETTMYEYDPIENYNRYENGSEAIEEDSTTTNDDSINYTGNDSVTNTGTNSDVGSGSDEVERTISAMNSGSYQPDNKEVTSLGSTMTHNINNKSVMNDNDTTTRDLSEVYDKDWRRGYGSHTHGNVGVTTTQEMIEQERKIAEFNVVQYIVDKFRDDLCLRVYGSWS